MAATTLDIKLAYKNGTPILMWVNRGDPFIIGSQTPAYNGYIASQRLNKTDLIGAPMIVDFILARSAHIIAWQAKVDDNPFATTTLLSSFSTGHNVIFQFDNPIVYENMVLKDKVYDINQDIFTYGNAAYKRAFDVWRGTLRLFITS